MKAKRKSYYKAKGLFTHKSPRGSDSSKAKAVALLDITTEVHKNNGINYLYIESTVLQLKNLQSDENSPFLS